MQLACEPVLMSRDEVREALKKRLNITPLADYRIGRIRCHDEDPTALASIISPRSGGIIMMVEVDRQTGAILHYD